MLHARVRHFYTFLLWPKRKLDHICKQEYNVIRLVPSVFFFDVWEE
jgi:hypothetical protein